MVPSLAIGQKLISFPLTVKRISPVLRRYTRDYALSHFSCRASLAIKEGK